MMCGRLCLVVALVLACPCRARAEEPSRIAVIPEAEANRFSVLLPLNVTGYWTPARDDIGRMDRAVAGFLETRAADRGTPARERRAAAVVRRKFGSCWRQYIGIVVGGERRIFCNAGSGEVTGAWKTEPIIVLDGGAGFWRIQYVPATGKCKSFTTNGEA